MTTRTDETRDDIARVIDDWLQERVAGLPAPRHAIQAALIEIHATPQAGRRSSGRWVDRLGGTKRPDDHSQAVGHIRTTRSVPGLARVDHAGAVALSSPAKVVAVGVMALTLGTALLIAQPVALDWGGAEAALPPVTGPARNGLIAFTRDGDIYVGDPVTGESEALIAGPEMDTSPRYSPDGTHIAFWRIRRPADEVQHGERDLVVVRADGADERVIKPLEKPFAADIGDFVWAPDSRWLVVSQPTGAPGPQMALSLLDTAGVAEARPLASNGPYGFGGDQVAWFLRPPSGDRVLVTAWFGDSILTVRDVDGSDVLDLGELSGLEEARRRWASGSSVPRYQGVREGQMAWSPDASRIAFVASFNSDAYPDHLYVMDADGSDLRRLNEEGGDFAWSPDGSTIAYERWVWAPGAIPADPYDGVIVILDPETRAEHVLDATTSPALPLPNGRQGPFKGWTWSPDGRSILYAPTSSDRLFTVDAETGEAMELPWVAERVPESIVSAMSAPSWQRVAAD